MLILRRRERDAILMRPTDDHYTDKDTGILSGLRGYGQHTVIYMMQVADIFHIHLVKLEFCLHDFL